MVLWQVADEHRKRKNRKTGSMFNTKIVEGTHDVCGMQRVNRVVALGTR